jgi:hypothetical protein
MYIVPPDPVAAIRAQARERARPLVARLARVMAAAWQRHLERQIESATRRLDHPGVQDDFLRAIRRG